MLILMSWLREHVPGLPPAPAVADALVRAGLEVEGIEAVGQGLAGVVVGEVLEIEEVAAKKKSVRWCQVRVTGPVDGDPAAGVRGIICGAFNFAVGDRVAVALPGSVLPGGFEITARRTYGHVSDGMICSARELGIGDDHDGIVVLAPDAPLGAHVAELLDLADDVLDVGITPDRGYALSIRGIAREAATAFGLPFADPVAPAGAKAAAAAAAGAGYPVTVEDTAACDRYTTRTITGVDPAAGTPLRWARRLALSGMRPISAAVDVTNAVMLGLGQPLHAFDKARLTGPIVVRRAAAGERLTTLDGVDRALDPEDLVIADDSGPIALAGVMGGASTEISATTTDIVLESAHFDPVVVARAARRHRLFSEASRRFERGVDPALAPAAAQEAIRLFAELAGGRAEPGATDVDHRRAPSAIRFPLSEPTRLGGRLYPDETVRGRLADVGCLVEDATAAADAEGGSGAGGAGGGVVLVTPPSWRPDLTRPADLVEEVMRLEGFDTIPVTLPRLPAGRGLTRAQRMARAIGRALAYEGLTEVMTLPFVGAGGGDLLGLPADDRRRAAVRIANPIAEDAAYLRTTLLPGLFDAAARNIGRGQQDVALFEIGQVFRELPEPAAPVPTPSVLARPSDDEVARLSAALPEQPRRVAGVLAGLREPAGVLPGDAAGGGALAKGRPADWADAVEAARAAARAVGVELTAAADEHAPWHPGRCAELLADGVLVGHAGELHPRVASAAGLPARTVAFELGLDELLGVALARGPVRAPVVSPYPPADRDVALVVEAAVPVADVTAALRDGAGELLEALTLFDVFEGSQVGAGRRSLAFGLRLRATDRTLTADEANGIRDAAVAEAARRTGAALRA